MKILPITPTNYSKMSFKRQLTPAEEKEMARINAQAKDLLGNNGNSVLVLHDACLPQAPNTNTGVSNLLNKESDSFFDFAKTYFGINTIQVHPQGEYINRPRKNKLVCPYSYSAFGLNNSLIDLETLTKESWRQLVKPEELAKVVEANNDTNREYLVNYENINNPNREFQKVIRKAYERFSELSETDDLKIQFKNFKTKNKEWLEPKVLYQYLQKINNGKHHSFWERDIDVNLYNNSVYDEKVLRAQREIYLNECKDDAEFYMFKQFVADSHLSQARENLHAKGLKLFGDMEINFAQDEIWACPKAFLTTHYIGANDWKAPSLNYYELGDENSAAAQFLKRKVAFMAERYDGIRFDASWMYISPALKNATTQQSVSINLGEQVLDMMEKEVKSVQGDAFNPENLIHEFKAGSEFPMLVHGEVRPEIASKITILESEYLNSHWGSFDYFQNQLNWSKDKCIMGVGDHTSQPLVQMALGMDDAVEFAKSGRKLNQKAVQAPILAEMFSDTVENMSKPANFIRAKFADIMCAKHNFIFFMDALGRSARFDSQLLNGHDNYRYKISADYKADYHKAIERGHALNLSDALAKAIEKAGLKESNKELHANLIKFAQLLKQNENEEIAEKVGKNTSNFSIKKVGIVGGLVLAIASLGGLILHKSSNREA